MLETFINSSESDQYSSTPKEISKFPSMYMTGYFCRSVYITFMFRTLIPVLQKDKKKIANYQEVRGWLKLM